MRMLGGGDFCVVSLVIYLFFLTAERLIHVVEASRSSITPFSSSSCSRSLESTLCCRTQTENRSIFQQEFVFLAPTDLTTKQDILTLSTCHCLCEMSIELFGAMRFFFFFVIELLMIFKMHLYSIFVL